MKLLNLAIIAAFSFAGLAIGQDNSSPAQDNSSQIGAANRVATTPAAQYVYHVRYHGRDGMLSINDTTVSFDVPNAPKHSVAWNYNFIKKFETVTDRNEIKMVVRGGDVHMFKLTSGTLPTADACNLVMQRVAAAPKAPTHS
jgi:hypothetical protein